MKRKLILSIISVLVISTGLISCNQPSFTDDFLPRSVAANRSARHSIDDIRQIVNSGGVVYQNLRVYSLSDGVKTTRVPMQRSQIEGLLTMNFTQVLRGKKISFGEQL